jgi:thiol-disulfide isomerase/thioredoxin
MIKLLKNIWPLGLALTVIIGIILAIENPFTDHVKDRGATPVVVTGQGDQETDALSAQELAALRAAVGTAEPPTPKPSRQRSSGPQAAEVEGIAAWINSDPLTIEGLRGKVVLLDFWTYTCVNCIRTFPYLKLWHARYADDGLVILGIHTPEFNFEKNLDNVVQATKDNGIVWPVALDNDYVTWENYSNRYWPAKYLIDQDGVVRYNHFGEGAYGETEEKIRELLAEAGADLSDDDLTLPADQTLDPVFLNTPNAEITEELYAGYEQGASNLIFGGGGYVGQAEYYKNKDAVVELVAPAKLSPNRIYFQGPWFSDRESARHGRETTNYEDYLTLIYSAKSVNVVLTAGSGQPYKVRVTMNGAYLTEQNKGEDIIIGPDGESFLLVTEPRLYRIVENPTYIQRETLRLSSNSDDFGLFAFTFGVYVAGP